MHAYTQGDSDHRTSESTSLSESNPTVAALRARMADFVGYPVDALEPLQVTFHLNPRARSQI